jgi:signal transduction histidine kinase
MIIHVYGVFNTILFVVLCEMFIETFAEKRELPKKWYRYALLVCMVIMDYGVSVALDSNIILKEIVIIGLGTLFMWLCFSQSYIKTAIMVLLYHGICIVLDYISILAISKCFPTVTMERLSEPLVFSIMGALSQMLLICFILFLRRCLVKKSAEMMTALEWLRFSVFPIFTIIVLVALLTNFEIPQSDRQKNILISIAFGLLVMNIIVFSLINDILKRQVRIAEDELLLERVKNETGMYRAISENYDKQLKREHEYKNQLSVIAALAHENKVDEINRYLKQYSDDILIHMDLIDTNNVIVNAVLNSKYQETREKGIVFVVKVNDLSELKVKDEDIVLILSNLLNNAIEANEGCEEAVIKLKFVLENNQVVISVVNTFSKAPLTDGNKFKTTKTEDADRHGIGLENIKETVEKYNGSCVVKHDNKNFKVAILLNNKNE